MRGLNSLERLYVARGYEVPTEHWQRGHQARMCPAWQMAKNPYPRTSQRGSEWLAGWLQAAAEIAAIPC